MATPAQDPLAGINSEIRLLRDQVDILQISAAEKTKPWYKQLSTLVSIAAFLISTIGGGISYLAQQNRNRQLDRADKLATLRQLTIDIVEVQRQLYDLDYSKDLIKANNFNILLNNKREIMVSRATELIDEIPDLAPSEILFTLAVQEQMDGHWQKAEKLILKALDKHDRLGTTRLPPYFDGNIYDTRHRNTVWLEKGPRTIRTRYKYNRKSQR